MLFWNCGKLDCCEPKSAERCRHGLILKWAEMSRDPTNDRAFIGIRYLLRPTAILYCRLNRVIFSINVHRHDSLCDWNRLRSRRELFQVGSIVTRHWPDVGAKNRVFGRFVSLSSTDSTNSSNSMNVAAVRLTVLPFILVDRPYCSRQSISMM